MSMRESIEASISFNTFFSLDSIIKENLELVFIINLLV